MQCLSAPTRKDVDRAHAAGSFLNTGISSVHNVLRNVSWKSLVWMSLVLTTIPIHLLLNSAFFGALQANNYGVMVATQGWEKRDFEMYGSTQTFDGYAQSFGLFNSSVGTRLVGSFASNMLHLAQSNELETLSKDDCFRRYSKQLQSTSSNVVVVTRESSGDQGVKWQVHKYSSRPIGRSGG